MKAEERQNSTGGAQPPAEPHSQEICCSPSVSCSNPKLAACCPYLLLFLPAGPQRPWFCSALWLWVLDKPRLSSTAPFHKCLGLGCAEDEESRARTARDVSCCFPPLYNCPGIPTAPGSPPAMAGKGTVSIYPSQFSAEAEGRVQQ